MNDNTDVQAPAADPVYTVNVGPMQGDMQERMRTTDRGSAIRFYNGLVFGPGFRKALFVDGVEVATYRQITDQEGNTTYGPAHEGFDWSPPRLTPGMDEADHVEGDPFSKSVVEGAGDAGDLGATLAESGNDGGI